MEAPLPKSHLRQAGTRGLPGIGLFLLGAALALYQLGRSNRPHELTFAPVVAVISLVALVLLGLAVRHLWVHLTSDQPGRAWAMLMLPIALTVALMDMWLLLGSASTIPDVLGG